MFGDITLIPSMTGAASLSVSEWAALSDLASSASNSNSPSCRRQWWNNWSNKEMKVKEVELLLSTEQKVSVAQKYQKLPKCQVPSTKTWNWKNWFYYFIRHFLIYSQNLWSFLYFICLLVSRFHSVKTGVK